MSKKWYEDKSFDKSDLGFFYSRMIPAAERLGLGVQTLGFTHGWPLFLLCCPKQYSPRVLIAAGFHGEEQAGPWALLRYLEIVPVNVLFSVNMAFLPIVNPTGFRKSRRFNDEGDSPNTGFIHPAPKEHLSIEGEILVKNKDLLVQLAQNGFLTLHEQDHAPNFYTYAFEKRKEPSEATKAIRDTGKRFFPILEDGPLPPPGGGFSVNGIVLNEHDGSFEDMLSHSGVHRCYTTETPMASPMTKRIQANMAVIRTFVKVSMTGITT
jgi:hypothetical protein